MQHEFTLVAQLAAVVTALEYVAAMALYFTAGPKRAADGLVSALALGAVALHLWLCLQPVSEPSLARSSGALAVLALSNLLFWSARRAHGASRPHAVFGGAVPPALVTQGAYRFLRHPFYAAYLLGFLGAALVGGHVAQFATTALLFAIYDRAAAQEERLMASSPQLGAAFASYSRTAGRWWPRSRAGA